MPKEVSHRCIFFHQHCFVDSLNTFFFRTRYTSRTLAKNFGTLSVGCESCRKLPEPHLLHKKNCVSVFRYLCLYEAVTSFERKIRALYISSKPFQERLLQIDLVESRIEQCRLQVMCCRSQLRTLFALPPLLVSLR
ncbi:unnamed protein product [Haemonchus placei]|uniref:Secreted protein n=1 Tax=Haemonchus placei TaxID=6290 RepID=A0A0N4X990_HAEPC|nr:unnamed protein product [Haemonchus placei]